MSYDTINKRKLRSKGVGELHELVTDVAWIKETVEGTKTFPRKKGKDYLTQKKFRKIYGAKLKNFDPTKYLSMIIECEHQMVNDSYEEVLQYEKLSLLNKLKEYYR